MQGGAEPVSVGQAMEMAVAHHRAGRLGEAENIYRQVLAAQPNFAPAHSLLGVIVFQMGRREEGIGHIRRALEINPDDPQALANLGQLLREAGQYEEALKCCSRAIQVNAKFPEAFVILGSIFFILRRFDEAIENYRKAIELRPLVAAFHAALGQVYGAAGNALVEKRDIEGAINCLKKALQQSPDDADAMNNLASCYLEQGKLEEAVPLFQRVIEIRPAYTKALLNLGNALRRLGRIQESVDVSKKAIEIQPTTEEAHLNFGISLQYAGRVEEAIGQCRAAIRVRPDFAEAHWNLALNLLLRGEFEEGWREYEWRGGIANLFPSWNRFPQPRWDGGDFRGKTLLVRSDQGIGDSIQFMRFVPLVAKKGGKVIFEVLPEVVRLFEQTEILSGIEMVSCDSSGCAVPGFDLQVSLMSLPWLLGKLNPAVDSDVVQPPYIKPDAALCDQWRARFKPGKKLKIGIAWAGNINHLNDRLRSTTLKTLAPLARVDAEFFNLQFGSFPGQISDPPAGMNLVDFTPMIRDFAQTAAMISNLDLIISVDTAIVHLAGAMSVPTWVLLQFSPDFRWLLNGDSTPWYPSLRLFRQKRVGDYDEVVERVAEELANLDRVRKSGATV